jgi:hypothetical protein
MGISRNQRHLATVKASWISLSSSLFSKRFITFFPSRPVREFLCTAAELLPTSQRRRTVPQYMATSFNLRKTQGAKWIMYNIFMKQLGLGREQILVDFPHKVLGHPW